MSRNYDDLLREVEQGDVLTVYYRNDRSNEINIDLVQIEKEGTIVLDKTEFEDKESFLIGIGLIGGLAFVGLAIYNYKNTLSLETKTPHNIAFLPLGGH